MTGHIIIFLIVAIVLLLIGVPVAATLGLSSILFFVLEGIPAMTVVQRLFSGCDVAALMCIPFFILAGDLMAKGGIAKRLVNVCNMAIGNVTGGLALVTIVVCAIFAAMTGSAMACCVTIGAIMLPYMLEAGYSREFSTAVFSAGAVLGPIIPPSTAMIIYAVNTNVSLTDLYLMGVPAGIYMAEYAKQGKVTEFLRMSIESLSSLPSIVIGLFGYLAFVLTFGATWNLLAGSLTVSILSIPLITTSTEDAIRALPRNFVEGSMALGSTHWYAIVHTLLPAALPRIGSGIILAAGRVFGEATALMYTSGMSTRIDWANWDLTSPLNALNPLRTGETLALHIWVMRSEAVDPNSAKIANFSAAILVIVVLLFSVIARRIVSNINKKQTGSAKK